MSDKIDTTVDMIYAGLTADFAQEALSIDSSRGFDLTSVKAQYVVERLNQVLGVLGWRFTGEYQEREDGGVLYFGKLYIMMEEGEPHVVEGVGFSAKKKNVGDTYKGARTDALSKAASMIGVANEVFKGNVKPVKGGSSTAAAPRQRAGGAKTTMFKK